MDFEKPLRRPVRTKGGGLRIEPKTLGDALDMIDEEVPDSIRKRPHWRQARNQIIEAAETGSQADIYEATARLVTALQRLVHDASRKRPRRTELRRLWS